MVTIEEKLELFTKLVLGKAQYELSDKLKEIEKQNQEKIKNYQQELQKQEAKIIEEINKKGIIERNKQISKAKLNAKKQILLEQQKLMEKQMENLRQKALEFTQHEGYESFLKQALSKIFSYFKSEPFIILYLKDQDIKRYQSLVIEQGKDFGFKEEQISIFSGDIYMIGGVIGINQARTFRIDLSMNALIEEHRRQIGQKLYDVLKEAGGIND
jgi:V/A-type H+-transporting ATPase subunit E